MVVINPGKSQICEFLELFDLWQDNESKIETVTEEDELEGHIGK